MNDKFLYGLHEEPEAVFAKNLHQKITRPPYTRLAQDKKTRLFNGQYFTPKRVTLMLAALIVVFAFTLAILPTVQAAVTEIIKTITLRGTTVWVSEHVPAIQGESETYSEIWSPVRPIDIAANYPEFAKLPTWVPDGYLLQERAAHFGSMTHPMPTSVLVEWKNDHGDIIQLKVSKGSCPNGQLWESGVPRSDCAYGWGFNVDSKSQPELIKINEQAALLFPNLQMLMNLSDPVKKWNPYRIKFDNRAPDAFFMIWESDGMRLEIATKSRTISKEDLVRFAKSIP
jgi:hypothetical protein